MNFIIQCVMFLLKYDLTYIAIGSLAILILCWLVRFIITLKEDKEDGER